MTGGRSDTEAQLPGAVQQSKLLSKVDKTFYFSHPRVDKKLRFNGSRENK